MNRALSLVLALILLFSVTSCAPDPDSNGEDTQKNVQNYDELEYKSTDRFTIDEILTFTHSEGSYLAEENSIIAMYGESEGGVIPFGEIDYSKTFTEMKCPFGVAVGDSLSDVEKKFSLDTGYAAYVKKGGSFQMYDSEKTPDITDGQGGCIYFGYALDGMGNWAFMDYTMLTALIRGQLVIDGATEAYNVVLYSCIVDDSLKVTQITALYGEFSTVMKYTS